jgi:lipid II isoglutaminyl synthase (glutamine-hydrolysing)
MSRKLVIAHLYPREMNIYGDLGNVTALVKRLEWRGYQAEVRPVEIGQAFDWTTVDVVFGGGGQDSGQLIMGADLLKHGQQLRDMAADGVPMLTICGMYQLFGRGFTTQDGRELPGIDVFRASTVGGGVRMIGNIVIDSPFGRLVGFENHSGQTWLEPDQPALGRVRKGYGNNPKSRREGAVTNQAIGTYLHGPVLPKNPALADALLLAALKRRHNVAQLEPLADQLELAAAKTAMGRPR